MWRLKLYRNAWYAVTRENGKSKRKALNTKDRNVAERRFQDYVESLKSEKELISDIIDAYRNDKTFKCEKTADFCIAKLKPFFGHLRPDQVNRELCRKYISERKIKSVRRELEVLRAALNWHDKHNKAIIELPPPPPPRTRSLSREEFETLLAAAEKTPHMRLFMIVALQTAARASAILDLTWDRVDFERGQINFVTGEQTNKRRTVITMNDELIEDLKKAKEGRTTDFVIEYGGKQVGTIIKGFTRTAKKAGLPDVTPHVLRHTAAVWMAEDGVPMAEISQFLGHTSTNVTERVYARFSPTYMKRAANSLRRGSRI
jgi:integrase